MQIRHILIRHDVETIIISIVLIARAILYLNVLPFLGFNEIVVVADPINAVIGLLLVCNALFVRYDGEAKALYKFIIFIDGISIFPLLFTITRIPISSIELILMKLITIFGVLIYLDSHEFSYPPSYNALFYAIESEIVRKPDYAEALSAAIDDLEKAEDIEKGFIESFLEYLTNREDKLGDLAATYLTIELDSKNGRIPEQGNSYPI